MTALLLDKGLQNMLYVGFIQGPLRYRQTCHKFQRFPQETHCSHLQLLID
jgi:hypothetical protein